MEENKVYYLYDIETGDRYPVSKEIYEMTLDMWKSVMPKLEDAQIKGSVIIVGTSGAELDGGFYKTLWEKPGIGGTPFKVKFDTGCFGTQRDGK